MFVFLHRATTGNIIAVKIAIIKVKGSRSPFLNSFMRYFMLCWTQGHRLVECSPMRKSEKSEYHSTWLNLSSISFMLMDFRMFNLTSFKTLRFVKSYKSQFLKESREWETVSFEFWMEFTRVELSAEKLNWEKWRKQKTFNRSCSCSESIFTFISIIKQHNSTRRLQRQKN